MSEACGVEREKGRERERKKEADAKKYIQSLHPLSAQTGWVCARVCERERGREREKKKKKKGGREGR